MRTHVEHGSTFRAENAACTFARLLQFLQIRGRMEFTIQPRETCSRARARCCEQAENIADGNDGRKHGEAGRESWENRGTARKFA